MAVHLVTGFKGEEHIQSADQGSFNASFFGEGEFVMEAGNQCEASILDNNTVRILDGDLLMQGRHIRIPSNTYIDVTIQTGTAGVNRNDMIVMEYSKDAGTGIETADLKVIKGVAAEGTASDPAYTSGDILAGDSLSQMPLYRVKVEGVVLSAVEPMFITIPTYKALAEQHAEKFQEACETHLNSLNILDSKEEVEANTQENQLAGALALKEVIASLGDAATIIYNPETDMIQILGSDGAWYDWKSGGLKNVYLYKDGDFDYDLLTTISTTGSDGDYNSIAFNDTHISYSAKVTSTWHSYGWIGKEAIDVTQFNSMKIEYSISSTKAIEDYNVRVGLSTSNDNDYTSVYIAESILLEIGKTSSSGIATINTSTLSGLLYLTSDFRMSVSEGLTITLNISKIWLEK